MTNILGKGVLQNDYLNLENFQNCFYLKSFSGHFKKKFFSGDKNISTLFLKNFCWGQKKFLLKWPEKDSRLTFLKRF